MGCGAEYRRECEEFKRKEGARAEAARREAERLTVSGVYSRVARRRTRRRTLVGWTCTVPATNSVVRFDTTCW
jgi:hypothetical protein